MHDKDDSRSVMVHIQKNREDFLFFDDNKETGMFHRLGHMDSMQLSYLQRYGQGRPVFLDSTHNCTYNNVSHGCVNGCL